MSDFLQGRMSHKGNHGRAAFVLAPRQAAMAPAWVDVVRRDHFRVNLRKAPKVGSVEANPLALQLVNLILKKRFRMVAEDLTHFSARVLRPGLRTQPGGISPLDHAPIE
jgi:hypothetical protein